MLKSNLSKLYPIPSLTISFAPYLLVFFGFIFIITYIMMSRKTFTELNDQDVVKIAISNTENSTKKSIDLEVEVVNSAKTVKQGLSDRDEIGSDGMLFIFPEASTRTFWMLRMHFDLDFVWIKDNEVVGITKNVKKPEFGVKNQDLEIISINQISDKVLELNAGDIDRYDIEVGDVVIVK